MIQIDNFKGVKATVQKFKFSFFSVTAAVLFAVMLGACSGGPAGGPGTADPTEIAARVNGKEIKMEEVDRAVKQQAQGQEAKMSPLELAAARLQVLQTLVEQEVMFQRAEKQSLVPTEDEVTVEVNKRKVDSHLSSEEFDKQLTQAGLNDKSLRENIRKSLGIQKLVETVTGKVEPPKDAEIEAFYNGNREAFVKKRGVKLAGIIIDPARNGEGDTTIDEQSSVIKANEIIKQLQQGADFASVAREKSEDQSRFQGGDLGYVSEDDLKQGFPAQVAAALMNPDFQIGKIITAQTQGKYYILKLQERSDKEEALTLEGPGIRQQVTDSLINSRKQLLAASYQAIAINEAKIENYLAKKVVENPNELSGARPAGAATPAPANSNTNAVSVTNSNTAALEANSAANSKANTVLANTKPAVSNTAAPKPANSNSGK